MRGTSAAAAGRRHLRARPRRRADRGGRRDTGRRRRPRRTSGGAYARSRGGARAGRTPTAAATEQNKRWVGGCVGVNWYPRVLSLVTPIDHLFGKVGQIIN